METGALITNILTDMPIGFTVGDKHYCLYPPTLGKIYLTSQITSLLQINTELLSVNPILETMRIVKEKKDMVCRLIAYHTLKTQEELTNSRIIDERTSKLSKCLDEEDAATLLLSILKESNYVEEAIHQLELDKEAERMARVNAAKKNTNTYIFGGRTIWGSLIDAACERYGWTFDYVVWGISYKNLALMLKDKVTSIYLSNEEAKHCHVPRAGEEVIDGNNRDAVMKAAMESEADV